MSEDLVITEDVEVLTEYLDIMESQIMVINEVLEQSIQLYDTMDEDRIKVVTTAYALIYKLQRKIMKQL